VYIGTGVILGYKDAGCSTGLHGCRSGTGLKCVQELYRGVRVQ